MADFTRDMIDVEELRVFLEDGWYIDCGEDEVEALQNVSLIHDLGFRMGSWYEKSVRDWTLRWRYLYLDCDIDEIHMCLWLDDDEANKSIPFGSLCERFPANDEDDGTVEGLNGLYDWMK